MKGLRLQLVVQADRAVGRGREEDVTMEGREAGRVDRPRVRGVREGERRREQLAWRRGASKTWAMLPRVRERAWRPLILDLRRCGLRPRVSSAAAAALHGNSPTSRQIRPPSGARWRVANLEELASLETHDEGGRILSEESDAPPSRRPSAPLRCHHLFPRDLPVAVAICHAEESRRD